MVLTKAPRGIEDDAQRVRPFHEPRRQLRVVGGNRAGADDDGVAERTQPVHMAHVLLAGHPARLSRVRGDEPVEALAEMTDRQRARRRRAADWQVQIDQRPAGIVGGDHRLPSTARLPDEQRSGVVGRHGAQVPALVQRETSGSSHFRQACGLGGGRDDKLPGCLEVGIHAVAGRL